MSGMTTSQSTMSGLISGRRCRRSRPPPTANTLCSVSAKVSSTTFWIVMLSSASSSVPLMVTSPYPCCPLLGTTNRVHCQRFARSARSRSPAIRRRRSTPPRRSRATRGRRALRGDPVPASRRDGSAPTGPRPHPRRGAFRHRAPEEVRAVAPVGEVAVLEQEAPAAGDEGVHAPGRVAKRVEVRRVEEKIAVPLDHDHADAGAAKGGKLFEAAAHGRIPEARKADEGAKEVAQENDLPCAAPLEPGDRREKPVQVAGDLPDVEIGEYGAQHAAC